MGTQDTKIIEDELSYLRTFYRLGVRIMQLAYNEQVFVGTGCCELKDGGLTFFGKEVVEEMNRLGMLIDLSHCGPQTTLDGIEYSKAPVAITHANARALCDTPRNKTDEAIKACAERGGVIGATAMPLAVKRDKPNLTIEDFLSHIDYMVKLVGVDHVGIGLDAGIKSRDEGNLGRKSSFYRMPKLRPDIFGPPTGLKPPMPKGLERHTDVPNITKGLLTHGYSRDEVKKILGENFLRLIKQVWH